MLLIKSELIHPAMFSKFLAKKKNIWSFSLMVHVRIVL